MATLIQIRRDSQANWLLNDPVLALGEMAYSTDQQKLKVGDGSSAWSELSYINALPSEITAEISAAIDAVVDAAPGTLDTLNELAAAINDDASFYTTITNSISSSINALDTDDIEEGSSNLYFTNQRALGATSAAYDAAGAAATAESNANSYTDGRETAITTAYQSYADTAEADAISTAAVDATSKANAAQAAAEATASADATAKADAAEADAITSANSYTDGRETAITTAYQTYADAAEADAVSTAAADATSKANSAQSAAEATAAAYTDARETAITTAYQAYADQAEADAETAAASYTDGKIADLIGGAPDLLNTLDEIAAAIADDENFSTTVISDIAQGLTDAKAYTDTRETAITTAYQSYADTAEADAVATAAADATSKANTAKSEAIAAAALDATDKANAAEADAISSANSYTDGRETAITTAYQTYADTAEADAITSANSYTDGRETAITTAYQTYADAAEADAISTAAADATTKADAALSSAQTYADTAEADAISTAAADATSKANAAQSAAEATASADATSKANAAESNAEAYADSLIGDVTVDGTGGNTVTDRIASAVAGLVDSAPAALDTLNELAAALGDDANFATTVATDIGTKVSKSGDTMTGDLTLAQDPTSNLHAATKQYVDTAEADAVSTASADATSKANTAESNANTYTDNAINALDTDDIEEGTTNLYYTNARVESVISTSDTDDLSEGTTNLYFTNQRAIDAVVENIAIVDLSDVSSTAPNDGELLMYSSSSSSWAPVAVIDGGTP